jgi:hypothetical protein
MRVGGEAMEQEEERMNRCKCNDLTSRDIRFALLTGHTETCPHVDPAMVFRSAVEIIDRLVTGMQAWAQDEDGIHPEAWAAYQKASAILMRPATTDPDARD